MEKVIWTEFCVSLCPKSVQHSVKILSVSAVPVTGAQDVASQSFQFGGTGHPAPPTLQSQFYNRDRRGCSGGVPRGLLRDGWRLAGCKVGGHLEDAVPEERGFVLLQSGGLGHRKRLLTFPERLPHIEDSGGGSRL